MDRRSKIIHYPLSTIHKPQYLPLPLAFLAPWRLENLLFNPQSSIFSSSSTPMTHQPPQHTLALAPWSVWSSASLALWEIFQVSGEDRFPLRPAHYHSHTRKTHA